MRVSTGDDRVVSSVCGEGRLHAVGMWHHGREKREESFSSMIKGC